METERETEDGRMDAAMSCGDRCAKRRNPWLRRWPRFGIADAKGGNPHGAELKCPKRNTIRQSSVERRAMEKRRAGGGMRQ
jgi:hypothetical protein